MLCIYYILLYIYAIYLYYLCFLISLKLFCIFDLNSQFLRNIVRKHD
jgi:hypothetical protein